MTWGSNCDGWPVLTPVYLLHNVDGSISCDLAFCLIFCDRIKTRERFSSSSSSSGVSSHPRQTILGTMSVCMSGCCSTKHIPWSIVGPHDKSSKPEVAAAAVFCKFYRCHWFNGQLKTLWLNCCFLQCHATPRQRKVHQATILWPSVSYRQGVTYFAIFAKRTSFSLDRRLPINAKSTTA